jgi:TolA-binding protein
MKKTLPSWLLAAALLNSCSLLQREPEEAPIPKVNGVEAPFAAEVNAGQGPALSGATQVSDLTPNYEAEISRMSTKIAALETKVDVLTANLERAQMKSAQPVIESGHGSAALAAAVDDAPAAAFNAETAAAPDRASSLPKLVKTVDAPSSAVEKDFRGAMDLFQAGQNLEASSQFALLAKKYPRHLLASHALYWAGEAGARGSQWELAIQNWQELEKTYPRSAYMPEALAGLARAYEKQGNIGRAKSYKENLLRAYPKAPVSLALSGGGAQTTSRVSFEETEEPVPTFDEGRLNGHSDEASEE